MSSATIHPAIRLTTPEELLGALPYLLGFHPEESLTILLLTSGRVQLTLRVDLPNVDNAQGLAGWLTGVMEGVEAETAVAIISSVHAARWQDELRHIVEAVEVATQAATVTLVDVLAEDRRTYRSCILGGPAVPFADDTLPVNGRLAAEVSPARSRAEAADRVERIPGLIDDLAYAAAAEAIGTINLPLRAQIALTACDSVARLMDSAPTDALRDAALLGVLVADVRVRDYALWTICTQDEPEAAERRTAALLWAALRQQDEYASHLEAMTGSLEFLLHGNGLPAVTLLERAVERDGNQLALLTSALIANCRPPAELHGLLAGLTERDILGRPSGPDRTAEVAPATSAAETRETAETDETAETAETIRDAGSAASADDA